jgi:myosin heavy subunit
MQCDHLIPLRHYYKIWLFCVRRTLFFKQYISFLQFSCNVSGVLEGIRICMRGFPNRMFYPDYKMRYMILGAKEIATATDNKTGVYALMDKINFSRDKYRLGHTKVTFHKSLSMNERIIKNNYMCMIIFCMFLLCLQKCIISL